MSPRSSGNPAKGIYLVGGARTTESLIDAGWSTSSGSSSTADRRRGQDALRRD
jgi:hypothetical protein